MSRLVTVRIEAGTTPGGLAASFAVDAAPSVRAGTLAVPHEAGDAIAHAFGATCAAAGHAMPPRVRVRAASNIESVDERHAASWAAGAIGARALLDLSLGDGEVAAILASEGAGPLAASFAAGASVAVHQICDDTTGESA